MLKVQFEATNTDEIRQGLACMTNDGHLMPLPRFPKVSLLKNGRQKESR